VTKVTLARNIGPYLYPVRVYRTEWTKEAAGDYHLAG